MKKHTTEQIIRKLREGETLEARGKGVAEICQALEISSQTYLRWRKRYGGLDGDDARRRRELEEESRRLKKLVADQALGHPHPQGGQQGKVVGLAATNADDAELAHHLAHQSARAGAAQEADHWRKSRPAVDLRPPRGLSSVGRASDF